jgi:hypothetical protein
MPNRVVAAVPIDRSFTSAPIRRMMEALDHRRTVMHKHITIEIGIDEDETTTLVHATLDLRGDRFHATGRAKRNPTDPPIPVIGEELALARALSSLERQVVDRAYDRIDNTMSMLS